jgi:transposase-like protein
MGEKYRHFSRELKRDVVQLVTEIGMPVGKVARELDIHPNPLHHRRRRFLAKRDKAFVEKSRVAPEEGCSLQTDTLSLSNAEQGMFWD